MATRTVFLSTRRVTYVEGVWRFKSYKVRILELAEVCGRAQTRTLRVIIIMAVLFAAAGVLYLSKPVPVLLTLIPCRFFFR